MAKLLLSVHVKEGYEKATMPLFMREARCVVPHPARHASQERDISFAIVPQLHVETSGGLDMKKILTIAGLMISTSAFAGPGSSNVTIRLSPDVDIIQSQTNEIFRCAMMINNHTGATLIATNLFSMPPGLALKVTGPGGRQPKTLYAPWLTSDWILHPGRNQVRWLYYGMAEGLNKGRVNPKGVSRPNIAKTLALQIEGTLSGTSYTNPLASNVVQVHIPR